MKKKELHYRCVSRGKVNNDLKENCNFSFQFEEGPHNCPLCGAALETYDPQTTGKIKNN